MRNILSTAMVLFSVMFASYLNAADPCTKDVDAGPIWNNDDAKNKCPSTCQGKNATWNGQWVTTQEGKMSVCGCTFPARDVNAGPIWNNNDAQGKCPSTCQKAHGSWNNQWRTTEEGKMSVCGCCRVR